MKIQLNEKGSTLLMVILMSAVLTILGTAMISMTFMNINMKANDDRAKRTMYYSESGIDEAYALVGSMVESTLVIAKEDTDAYRRALLQYLETTVVWEDPLIPPPHPGQVYPTSVLEPLVDPVTGKEFQEPLGIKEGTEYVEFYRGGVGFTSEDMQIDEEALGKQLDRHYKKEFKEEFNTAYYDKLTVVEPIERQIIYEINNVDGLALNGDTCDVEVSGAISAFDISNDDPFIIHEVNSNFVFEGRTERNIQVDIVINAPESIYPVQVIDDTIKVEDNPIWQNALVSNTDIFFTENTDSTVNGDIYALGSFENELTGEPKYNLSGISIDEGNVVVNGDLVTRAYIQTKSTDDSLTVNDGLVYCNTLSTTTGSINSSIRIMNGNLYTKDDLELNAVESDIRIEGSYYGISDGSIIEVAEEDEDEEVQTKHYNSSAIVINAPLTDASIEITGAMPNFETLEIEDFWYNPNLWSDADVMNYNKFDESEDGVWIPGTAYINIEGTGNADYWPYQTGESVSIKENYLAYSLPMTFGVLDPLYKFDYSKTLRETAANGAELVFGTITSLEGVTPVEVDYFNYQDKVDYIIAISNYPDYEDDTSLIQVGDPSSINISNYKYVLGTIIENDGTTNQLADGPPSNPIGFATLSKVIRNDFIYYLNNSVRNSVDDDSTDTVFPSSAFNVIEEHVDYATTTLDNEDDFVIEDYVFATELNQQAREVYYVSNPESGTKENYRLVGVGAGAAIDGYTDILPGGATPGYYQGIIITQGDVIIDGDVHFTGSIIAGGNIEIRGGESEFHNSEEKSVKYLARFIRNHTELRKLLLKGSSGKMIAFFQPSIVNDVVDSNLTHAFKDLVDIKSWRIN